MKKQKSGWIKIKIGFLLIVLLLVALVGYQNKALFLYTHDFEINLIVYEKLYPEVENAAFLAGFFFAGLLLTFLLTLSGKFKSRKTIKELDYQIKTLHQENDRLENEVRALKAGPPVQPDGTGNEEDSAG